MNNSNNNSDKVRLYTPDLIRSIAIIVIILIHRVHYTWVYMQDGSTLGMYLSQAGVEKIIVIIAIILFSFAGIFYFISGLVNAYSTVSKILSSNQNPKKIRFSHYYIAGLVLIVLNYLYRIILMNGFLTDSQGLEPEFPVGLLTSVVTFGQFPVFRMSLLTVPGTLFILGLILLCNTGIIHLWTKSKAAGNPKILKKIFLYAAFIMLLIYPFAKFWFMPLYDEFYTKNQFLLAFLTGHFSLEFSPFPYISFGFFGAFLGVIIATTTDPKSIQKEIRIPAIILTVTGILGMIGFDSDTLLGERLVNASINFIGLGLFLILTVWLLKRMDFRTSSNKSPLQKLSIKIRHFGSLSLTIFLLEGLVAATFGFLVNLIFGTLWRESIGFVSLFAFGCLGLWILILFIWSKVNFKYSIEYLRSHLVNHNKSKNKEKKQNL